MMLGNLPYEILLKIADIVGEDDLNAVIQLSLVSKKLSLLSQDQTFWYKHLGKDFASNAIQIFHERVEKTETRANLLENYSRATPTPEQIAEARARIPTPKDFYQYLTFANIAHFILSCKLKDLTSEEESSLEAMRTWYKRRAQQNFRRINEDMRNIYMPGMRILLRTTLRTTSDHAIFQDAIYWNHVAAARILIRHSTILNFADHSDETPLTAAAKVENVWVLKDLLAKGADYESPSAYGWNPLMVAAYRNHLDAARALVKAGASPLQFGRYPSETPLSYARQQAHQEMVALLEEAVDAQALKQLPFANGMRL